MDKLYIVDHPTKGTQAFATGGDAASYAGGVKVRCWVRSGGPRDMQGWREVSRAEMANPLRGRRR